MFENHNESVVILTWCQKCFIVNMSLLCKPPEPLSFMGNVVQNWQEFSEQLQWFLEGTESAEKGDKVKIGCLMQAKKHEKFTRLYSGPPMEIY